MSSLTLYYWGIRARGQLSVLIARYGDLPLEWNRAPDWPGMKDQTVFGQLPFLVDGDVKVSQSGAIARYLARKANLLGSTDADFAISEMLVEEQVDLFGILGKANYAENKEEAYTKVFAEDFPAHLARVENLLGDSEYFTSQVTLGTLAIFSILNLALDLESSVLDKTPKLKAFYERVAALPQIKPYLDENLPPYLKRD